jgi:hypothetical protein
MRKVLAVAILLCCAPFARGQCTAPSVHCAKVTWIAPDPSFTYNFYAFVGSCPATAPLTVAAALTAGFVKLNSAPITTTSFVDNGAPPPFPAGSTHCDFITSVGNGGESVPSALVQVTTPLTIAGPVSPPSPPSGVALGSAQ